MSSFYQVEASAMLRNLHSKNIGTVFRFIEFLFAILFFAWSVLRSSPYFAAVFNLSGLILSRFSSLIVNHHFVFLLGNSIIVALFFKFGRFACDAAEIGASEFQICEIGPQFDTISSLNTIPEEKRTIPAEKEASPAEMIVARTEPLPEVKRYRRSRSSVCDRRKAERLQIQIRLRRSETEPRRSPVRRRLEVDDLSSEEFRRKIESVIEKHRRSLREEESPFVVAV